MSRSRETWTTALARSLLQVGEGRTATVILQLPLAGLLAIVWISTAATGGTAETAATTATAFLVSLGLLAVGLATPWSRLPPSGALVIPLLDAAAVALAVLAVHGYGHALGMLFVFPAVWLAASGLRGRWMLTLVLLGAAVVALPAWLTHPPGTPGQTVLALLLPLGVIALAVCVHAATAHQREQDRLLAEQREAAERAVEESRHSAELLSAGLAAIDVGILVIDEDGHAVSRNAEMERLLTVAAPEDPLAADDLASSEPQFLVHGADGRVPVPAARRPVARALSGEDFSHQLLWIGDCEHPRAVSVTARSVWDGPARRGSVLAFTDVTDLLHAVAARDQLLATVTHDLRSPLSAILGRADLALERGGLPERTERDLTAIVHGAEHMQSIVQDLLHTSAGGPQAVPLPADLVELIEETVAAAEHAATDAEVDLALDLPDQLPALVDPIRMRRVLDNLLVNAIKYSPVGGEVLVRALASEDGEAVVEVQDRGRGMTEAEAGNAFTRFYRADSARHSAVPGVGLGLYICKSIVDAHGGTIECRSRPNEGTTFTLRLPRAADEAPDGGRPGPRAGAPSPDGDRAGDRSGEPADDAAHDPADVRSR